MRTNRIVVLCVSFYVALLAASAALAQQTVEIKTNPVMNSYTAVVKGPDGESSYTVIKDPTSPFLNADDRMKGAWHELTQLGNLPWGTPASSFEQIRKDPNVRGYVETDTNLSTDQKSALYKALDDPGLKVMTIDADQMPILAVIWGRHWFRNKVSYNLDKEFTKTKVYLFFVLETKDWYSFHAYCRNLGQPAVGYAFQAHVEEVVPPPPPPVVVPKVVPPSCTQLERTDNKLSVIQTGQTAQLAASFNNPSGVDFAFRYVAINKANGERSLIVGFGPTASVSTNDAVNYRIFVEGEYEGKPIQASACVLELSFFNPPSAHTPPPPPEQIKTHSNTWKYIVAGVAAAAIVGFVASRHKGTPAPVVTPVKTPVCVPTILPNGTTTTCPAN